MHNRRVEYRILWLPVRSKSIICGQSLHKLPILQENNRKTQGVK